MIQANELRVGNLIIGNTGIETVRMIMGHEGAKGRTVVHEIYKHLIGVEENRNQYNLAEVQPIPLSEEWLVRLGFKQTRVDIKSVVARKFFTVKMGEIDEAAYHKQNIYLIKRGTAWIVVKGFLDKNIKEQYGLIGIDTNYVHQLQNLYFALTGEELALPAQANSNNGN